MPASVVEGDMSLRLLAHLGQIAGAAVIARQDDLRGMVVPGLDTCGGGGVVLEVLLAGSGTSEAGTSG